MPYVELGKIYNTGQGLHQAADPNQTPYNTLQKRKIEKNKKIIKNK